MSAPRADDIDQNHVTHFSKPIAATNWTKSFSSHPHISTTLREKNQFAEIEVEGGREGVRTGKEGAPCFLCSVLKKQFEG